MRLGSFDEDVAELLGALQRARVDHVVLEDDDFEVVTIVPAPARRNLARLASALEPVLLGLRVDGEPEALPLLLTDVLSRAPARWPLLTEFGKVDVLTVAVEDGSYGALFLDGRTHRVDGLAVTVVESPP